MSFVPSALRSACAPILSLARTPHAHPCVTFVCRNAHASSSFATARPPTTLRSFSTAPTATRSLLLNAGRGKQRWGDPQSCTGIWRIAPSPLGARIYRQPSGRRSFHATARREALPLLPALGVFFKVSRPGTTKQVLTSGHDCSWSGDRFVARPYIFLPYWHPGHLPFSARSNLARKGQAHPGRVTRCRGVLEDVVRGRAPDSRQAAGGALPSQLAAGRVRRLRSAERARCVLCAYA